MAALVLISSYVALKELPSGQHGSTLEIILLSLDAIIGFTFIFGGQSVLGLITLGLMVLSYIRL